MSQFGPIEGAAAPGLPGLPPGMVRSDPDMLPGLPKGYLPPGTPGAARTRSARAQKSKKAARKRTNKHAPADANSERNERNYTTPRTISSRVCTMNSGRPAQPARCDGLALIVSTVKRTVFRSALGVIRLRRRDRIVF